MDYSMPDSSVLHYLPEIAQIHVQQIVISDIKKVPSGRAWQPIPVFLTGESPLTEEPDGYGPLDYKKVGHDWVTNTHTHTHTHTHVRKLNSETASPFLI